MSNSSLLSADYIPFVGELELLNSVHHLEIHDEKSEFADRLDLVIDCKPEKLKRFHSSWFQGWRPEEEYDDLSYQALADFLNSIESKTFGYDESGKCVCAFKTFFKSLPKGDHMETTKPDHILVYI